MDDLRPYGLVYLKITVLLEQPGVSLFVTSKVFQGNNVFFSVFQLATVIYMPRTVASTWNYMSSRGTPVEEFAGSVVIKQRGASVSTARKDFIEI